MLRLLSTVFATWFVAVGYSQAWPQDSVQDQPSQRVGIEPLISDSPEPRTWVKSVGAEPTWLTAGGKALDSRVSHRKLLGKELNVEFTGLPLDETLKQLGAELGVPFALNHGELEQRSVDPQTPITLAAKGPLREILRRLLAPLDLSYRATESNLEITSNDDVRANPTTCYYDLSYFAPSGAHWDIIPALQLSVDPDIWLSNGGHGAALAVGSMLAVHAPEETQHKVRSFLYELSKMHPDHYQGLAMPQAQSTWVKADAAPEWWRSARDIAASIVQNRDVLSKQVVRDSESVALQEVMQEFSKELAVQVEIDLVALEELGIEEDLPITISGEGTVRDLFRRMLHPLELTYRVNESTIEITSQEEADENPAVRLYDLSYVQSTMDLDAIHNAIMQTIDPDSWPMGGGGIYFVGSMLVIAAPEERQLKVQMLLSKLSKMNPQNQVSVSNY